VYTFTCFDDDLVQTPVPAHDRQQIVPGVYPERQIETGEAEIGIEQQHTLAAARQAEREVPTPPLPLVTEIERAVSMARVRRDRGAGA
jgi:hypothetical protein